MTEALKGPLTSNTSIVIQDNKAVVKIEFTTSNGRHIDFTCTDKEAIGFGATLVAIGTSAIQINERSSQ